MKHNQIRTAIAMLPSAVNLVENNTIKKITIEDDRIQLLCKFTDENFQSLSFLNPDSLMPAPGVYEFKFTIVTFILDEAL